MYARHKACLSSTHQQLKEKLKIDMPDDIRDKLVVMLFAKLLSNLLPS